MSYRSDLISSVKKALVDPRCAGSILHIEELFNRYTKDGQVYPRMFDKDKNPIEDIDTLVGLIVDDQIELRKMAAPEERYTNSLSGVRVILKNIIIINNNMKGDTDLNQFGAGDKNLVLVMSYWLDNDKEVPMKINYIDLVNVKEDK